MSLLYEAKAHNYCKWEKMTQLFSSMDETLALLVGDEYYFLRLPMTLLEEI